MKVRNGWIVVELTVHVFPPAKFGWLFRKATLRPFSPGVEALA